MDGGNVGSPVRSMMVFSFYELGMKPRERWMGGIFTQELTLICSDFVVLPVTEWIPLRGERTVVSAVGAILA